VVGNRGTRWDVDLRDIEVNVSYFDSATRTYRIVIGGLPGWLADSVVAQEAVGARVRVLFRTSKADGESVVLQDLGFVGWMGFFDGGGGINCGQGLIGWPIRWGYGQVIQSAIEEELVQALSHARWVV
jgi:hypothetical protein